MTRVRARRLVFVGALVAQAVLIVRGADSDHAVLAWRMFPEASEWRADLVRIDSAGERHPIPDSVWARDVRTRRLWNPSERHHADAGIDNQLAFLQAAIDWYADRTADADVVEARVTYWRNADPPRTIVLRSDR